MDVSLGGATARATHRVVLKRSMTDDLMGIADVVERREVPQQQRGQMVLLSTLAMTSHDSGVDPMERAQIGQTDDKQLDIDGISDHWSPACTTTS